MPLYLGNLTSMLPLPDMAANEQIMLQIAEGLNFMHSNQILHRDLKPDNILVSSPRSVKIADYGWAVSLKDTDSLHGMCGTVAYCAPEALRTDEIHTPAIDVYSLGAVFYQILDPAKVGRGWVRRLYRGRMAWFNTTFENPRQNSSHHYSGLVQCMLDSYRRGRCSLDESIEILKAQNYNWTRQNPVIPVAAGTNSPFGYHPGMHQTVNHTRLQQTPFGKARAKVIMPVPTPVAQERWPEKRHNPHHVAVKHNINNWQPICGMLKPATPVPQASPMQKPPRSKPAHVQGINFNTGLPSYEEALSQNPFAPLAPRVGTKKKPSHRGTNLSNIHPAYRPKEPLAPAAHNKPKEKNVTMEASSAARVAPQASNPRHQLRNTRQPARRSHNRALNLHRARDARIHRQADRQEAREKRKTKLKEGLCEATMGTWKIVTALVGFACDGLVVGGERVYDRFKNNRAAREALEHVVANVNADARLVASVQRQAAAAGRLRSASRMCKDAEMLDRQLLLSRRR